jgi:hypothetical protein
MDRLNRTLAGCGLALLLAAGGCRSTQPEVPPGRPYTSDGRQAPPSIGFSSDPHPMAGPGMASGMPGAPQLGTPGPASTANYGTPTNNMYGPPATGTGVGALPPAVGLTSAPGEPTSMPATGLGGPSTGYMPMSPPASGASAGPGAAGSPAMPPGTP